MADDERETFLATKRADNYNVSNTMAEKWVIEIPSSSIKSSRILLKKNLWSDMFLFSMIL